MLSYGASSASGNVIVIVDTYTRVEGITRRVFGAVLVSVFIVDFESGLVMKGMARRVLRVMARRQDLE